MTDISASETPSDAEAAVKGRSLWQDARRRFLQNRAAVVSLIVLSLIALIAVVGPFFAKWDNEMVFGPS